MPYFSAPMLSASFTPQGKKVRQRLENILTKNNKKKGYFLPLCALALLMAGTLVACATARAADTETPPAAKTPAIPVTSEPDKQTQLMHTGLAETTEQDPDRLPLEPSLDEALTVCEADPTEIPVEPECEPEEEPAAEAVAYQRPLAGRLTILATFGERAHPITGMVASHHGVDLAAEEGTPVLAAADGTVAKAEYGAVYGHHALLTHADGSTSLYGHLSALSVEAGQTVAAGEELGRTGQSGWATGPHLHFELRDAEGAAMDPTAVVS